MTRREMAGLAALVPLCAGLAAGTVHAAWYLTRRFLLQRLAFEGADVVWMAPLSYVLLLAIPGIPLVLLLALVPRQGLWRLTVFICAACALFSVLLLVRQLHPAASLVLAAGIAARLTQMAGADPQRSAPWLRRLTAVLAALAALGAAAARGLPALTERRAQARLPPAPDRAPNVLLLVIDTERAQNLSLYGYPRPTSPVLVRRAAEAAVFDRAIAPAPWTLPSHAAMFTGLNAGRLSARWLRPFSDPVPTLATVLRARGYATAGFAANFVYAGEESGLARGFSHYESHLVSGWQLVRLAAPWQTGTGNGIITSRSWRDVWSALRAADLRIRFFPSGEFRRADRISADFLGWQTRHRERPFFAFINVLDVHEYSAPPAFRQRFQSGRPLVDGYDAATAFVDSVLGATLDTLEARGVLNRTILIITSDHGEHLGEHGLRDHGNSLFMPVLHVPLVIRFPGAVPGGARIAATVSTRNIAATVLDLARIGGSALPGTSLADAWRGGPAPEPALAEVERHVLPEPLGPAQRGAMRAVVDDAWHYIRGADGGEELFAYREDTAEATDRSKRPEIAAMLERLRGVLRRTPSRY